MPAPEPVTNETLAEGIATETGGTAEIIGTGGGCQAIEVRHPNHPGEHLLITDGDAALPIHPDGTATRMLITQHIGDGYSVAVDATTKDGKPHGLALMALIEAIQWANRAAKETPKLRRVSAGNYRYDDIEILRVRLWDGWWWIAYGPVNEGGHRDWTSDPYPTLREAKACAEASWLTAQADARQGLTR